MRGSDDQPGTLSSWQEGQVWAAVDAFLAEPSLDAPPPLGDSLAAARAAFSILKAKLCPSSPLLTASAGGSHAQQLHDQLSKLQAQVCDLLKPASPSAWKRMAPMWSLPRAGAAARPGDPHLGDSAEGARRARSEAVGATARQAEALSCDRTSIRDRHGHHAVGCGSQLRLFCSSFRIQTACLIWAQSFCRSRCRV